MRKNKRLSYEEKLLICTIYEKGEGSLRQLASQFGAEALRMQGMNQSYTETFIWIRNEKTKKV